jgi:type II secretory pathway pseudopilin PulG
MNQSSLVISILIALAIVGVVLAIVLTRKSGSKNQSVPTPKVETKVSQADCSSSSRAGRSASS